MEPESSAVTEQDVARVPLTEAEREEDERKRRERGSMKNAK